MRFFNFIRYIRDEVAAISAFVLIMFLTMIVGGGMGIDFMYHESERSSLQDALDRGVLAAASFEVADRAGVDLEARVVSYLRSNELLARRNPTLNITTDVNPFSRRITVDGSYEIDTFFLKLIGINTLTVSGSATARTSRGKVEIALVLDNSGSMYGEKMDKLTDAANNFIDMMITPESASYTTMSIVPFSSTVNAGEMFSSYYNLNEWHDYSYCFEFVDADFYTTTLLPSDLYEQGQHLLYGEFNGEDVYECAESPIFAFSNNRLDLRDSVNNMVAAGNTSTWAGMKWGAALLDPRTRPVVAGMIADNRVAPIFADRPLEWNDPLGTKFIVMMTDGENTDHFVLEDTLTGYNSENTVPWNSQENADYWDTNVFYTADIDADESVDGVLGDARLFEICDAAKADIPGTNRDRIIIFTIGFDVAIGSNPYNMMRDCASSVSKFYHVDDAGLNSAFTQIARAINKLRLVD